MKEPKIIVALDFPSGNEALSFVQSELNPQLCRVKVGKELFTSTGGGPELVQQLVDMGYDVFLDLKFHDIPNTVAKAVAAAAELGVWMVNIHAIGGSKMMNAAREALEPYGVDAPLLIAVTVLTSMDKDDLLELGMNCSPEEQVARLVKLADQSGLDGVVCSAKEASIVKQISRGELLAITPGIRPKGSTNDDQKRIMTPEKAIAAGSDYLVMGRPITKSDNPALTLEKINDSFVWGCYLVYSYNKKTGTSTGFFFSLFFKK